MFEYVVQRRMNIFCQKMILCNHEDFLLRWSSSQKIQFCLMVNQNQSHCKERFTHITQAIIVIRDYNELQSLNESKYLIRWKHITYYMMTKTMFCKRNGYNPLLSTAFVMTRSLAGHLFNKPLRLQFMNSAQRFRFWIFRFKTATSTAQWTLGGNRSLM